MSRLITNYQRIAESWCTFRVDALYVRMHVRTFNLIVRVKRPRISSTYRRGSDNSCEQREREREREREKLGGWRACDYLQPFIATIKKPSSIACKEYIHTYIYMCVWVYACMYVCMYVQEFAWKRIPLEEFRQTFPRTISFFAFSLVTAQTPFLSRVFLFFSARKEEEVEEEEKKENEEEFGKMLRASWRMNSYMNNMWRFVRQTSYRRKEYIYSMYVCIYIYIYI